MPDIKELRVKIDKIDDQLLKLINRRAALAVSIGKEKFKKNQAGHFHVPHREREIIRRLTDANKGPFPDESVEMVFREIFSATLALEKPLKIAFLGPETTFSHQAAIKQFGHSSVLSPFNSIEVIFSEVEQGNCAYGIVPVENANKFMATNKIRHLAVTEEEKIVGMLSVRDLVAFYANPRLRDSETVNVADRPSPFRRRSPSKH